MGILHLQPDSPSPRPERGVAEPRSTMIISMLRGTMVTNQLCGELNGGLLQM